MKLGMVFEGGASRTVFSCGVADAFLEENLMPDYFIGVSAGIAYGVSYLSKQKRRNYTIATEYMSKPEYQGLQYLLDRSKRTYYNLAYVFDEMPREHLPFDYDTFAAYPGKVEAAVTNIHTGRAEYIEVPRDEKSRDVLVASCALPIFFQPVKLGRRYYLDGGIADSIPYEHALKEGCDKIIVVLTRERGYIKHTDESARIASVLYRRYPNIAKALKNRAKNYNASMNRLMELKKEGRVFVIAPDDTHGIGRTETDPKKLELLYEEGYLEAKEQMTALKNYLAK